MVADWQMRKVVDTMQKPLDTSYFDRRLAKRLDNPAFREEYDRASRYIAHVDAFVRQLDDIRKRAGISKAEVARRSGLDAASVRRLFSSAVNPEWQTLDAIADALEVDIKPVPRHGRRERKKAA
jgi:DNA-binding phage protein